MSLFDFLSMQGTYEERMVARHEGEDLIISTARNTDAEKPFETAISHEAYNSGSWIVVEEYDTEAEANLGHKKWVRKMTSKKLPKSLKDVTTSGAGKYHFSNEEDRIFMKDF